MPLIFKINLMLMVNTDCESHCDFYLSLSRFPLLNPENVLNLTEWVMILSLKFVSGYHWCMLGKKYFSSRTAGYYTSLEVIALSSCLLLRIGNAEKFMAQILNILIKMKYWIFSNGRDMYIYCIEIWIFPEYMNVYFEY